MSNRISATRQGQDLDDARGGRFDFLNGLVAFQRVQRLTLLHERSITDQPLAHDPSVHREPEFWHQHGGRHVGIPTEDRTACAMAFLSGKNAFSSTFENGTGHCGAPIRRTLCFSCPCRCSLIHAAISAPTPKFLTASCTMTARPVFATDSMIVVRSNGATVRK